MLKSCADEIVFVIMVFHYIEDIKNVRMISTCKKPKRDKLTLLHKMAVSQ